MITSIKPILLKEEKSLNLPARAYSPMIDDAEYRIPANPFVREVLIPLFNKLEIKYELLRRIVHNEERHLDYVCLVVNKSELTKLY